MARPTITVRIAFATDPLDPSPTWTDVSAYVRGEFPLTIRRGRQYELNRVEAGTAQVPLDNRDRRFDPSNTSSPYYPNILPMRKINIRATWSAVTYDVFTGYIENWPPDWDNWQDSTVMIDCVDGFKYFAAATLTLTVPSTGGGWQIKAQVGSAGFDGILENLDWATGDQSVNAGDSTLQGWTMTNETVLQRLQLITESEGGYLMMTTDGKIFFRERHYRLTSSSSKTSQGTFGDGGGAELPYLDLDPSFDDAIYNDIHVTRVGGAEQVAQDATSIARYFKRSLPKSGLLMQTDTEALAMANYLLSQYKDAALRFRRMTIAGPMNSSLWVHVLGRDINHRITVVKRPPGGGTITQDCFVEGIQHTISLSDWLTSFDLSPASTSSYWVLGDSVLSILGSTTKLVY